MTNSGVVIGTFAGTTTLTVTLNSAANKTAVQALLRNISFSSLSGAPSILQRTITATLSDGDGGTSLAVSTIVEVVAVNDAPVIGAFTPDITYVENSAPLLIDNNATVTDVDSLDFAAGFMTVGLTTNGHLDDRLSIRNQGSAANQIGVTGNQLTYSGVVIGSFAGGTTGLIPLQVTFNSVASKTAVQALVRNLTFSNVSDNPSTLPRTVSLFVNDGDGGTSIPVTKMRTVSVSLDSQPFSKSMGNSHFGLDTHLVWLPRSNHCSLSRSMSLLTVRTFAKSASLLFVLESRGNARPFDARLSGGGNKLRCTRCKELHRESF